MRCHIGSVHGMCLSHCNSVELCGHTCECLQCSLQKLCVEIVEKTMKMFVVVCDTDTVLIYCAIEQMQTCAECSKVLWGPLEQIVKGESDVCLTEKGILMNNNIYAGLHRLIDYLN